MKGKIGGLLATVIGLVLLGYSAYRSYDFVAMTLPADKQVIAYFALAALDGGLIAWLLAFLYGSNGAWQRAISAIMILVDFVGAVVMFSLDTIYNAGQAGLIAQMDPSTTRTAMLILSGVIAANIAATVAHHLTNPETMRRMAEEEARAKVEDLTLKLISENANALASDIAPQIAKAWKDSMATEYGHRIKAVRERKALTPPSEDVPALEPGETEVNPTTPRRSRKS